MPLIVPCQELSPGMRLAEAFVFNGRTMLPGGKVVSADDVSVMGRKYPQAMLKVGDPILDAIVAFDDDSKDREVAHTARSKIIATVSDVHQRLAAQTAHGGIDFVKAKSAVADVMEFLTANPVTAALVDRSIDAGGPLAEHAGTAFYLTMVLGSAVRDYVVRERQRQTSTGRLPGEIAMNLLPLGLGAMFMDVGMAPLAHVFAAGYELTPADRQAILDHPKTGADMLPENLPTGVKLVVRTHHENFDGTGYPAAAAAAGQHVFTRIARVTDAFAAATGRRAFRGAKSPARAVWEMSAGPYRRFYDPVLVRVFASLIQPFPIGAKVRLADGRTGVVARYNRKEPFRPHVVVAFGADGARLPQEQLKSLTPDELAAGSPTRLASYDGEDLGFLHAPADGPHVVEVKPFGKLVEAAYP